MSKFATCLWFDSCAEEAVRFYTTVFDRAEIKSMSYYGGVGQDVHHREKGSLMTITCSLDGLELMGLNGGPVYTLSPAISLYVSCRREAEVERLYSGLSEGGSVLMPLDRYPFSEKYAWVSDRFGASWQLNLTGEQGEQEQKISPCLMFTNEHQGQAGEAIGLYTSIFKDSKVDYLHKYEAGELKPGLVKHASFTLSGQRFIAMDSPIDHEFTFSHAESLIVRCDSQDEIDYLWETLTKDGGKPDHCGWLTDRFGVSWQIVPRIIDEMVTCQDEERKDRVLSAIMKMVKLEVSELEKACR
ncbi:MAG: VOC family protein [Candidatus Obscuribacterales bacterium]